jgi:hypothetical protein
VYRRCTAPFHWRHPEASRSHHREKHDRGDGREERDGGASLVRLTLLQLIVIVALALPDLASVSEHRSRAVAREFQRDHPCPSTGLTTGACPGYRKDHIMPLACGGPDAVSNMQWQTIRDARAKDAWERKACAR